MPDQMHQIGEVAAAVDLSLRTIRYYEETGLVPPSGRSAGGFRLYVDADIERLRFVKALKPFDLTIDEMRALLTARDRIAAPDVTVREKRELAEQLAEFVARADARCKRLRAQLDAAEQLCAELSAEVADARDRYRVRQPKSRTRR